MSNPLKRIVKNAKENEAWYKEKETTTSEV